MSRSQLIRNHGQDDESSLRMATYIGETYIADDPVQFLFREGFINLFENDLQRARQEIKVV